MVVGIDTDVLVHWAMAGAAHHRTVRKWLEREVEKGRRLGLTQQVLYEHLHVVTDPRRFENPLSMEDALDLSAELWASKEVVRILPTEEVLGRTWELMRELQLGRKRILDTALAATLEAADVSRLATLNPRDFQIFSFLEIVDPTSTPDSVAPGADRLERASGDRPERSQ